jgi:hypothetical protein
MAHLADELAHKREYGYTKLIDGKWVVARPIPAPFIQRLKDAWLVLIGKADAVKFYKQ